ncbi:MAG: M48 family peptidase [Zetaproteobacteria bacterium]|nr:MAG: M48 family peptidase [Zetaproteobacteria bacterium]
MSWFTTCFLILLGLMLLVEFWLAWRQGKVLLAHRSAVPEPFEDVVSLSEHRKAIDYARAKLAFGRVSLLWSSAWLLLWTLGGGLNALDGWMHDWFDGRPLLEGMGLMLLFLVLSHWLEAPLDAWRTFVIEQRFGFNHMKPGMFVVDLAKQTGLLLLLGAPLSLLVLWIMQLSSGLWWIWAWLAWSGFSLLMVWLYPTLIAPMFNRFEPLPEGDLKSSIEQLLRRCGFKSNGLFVMDGSRRSGHGNAYFTGFGSAKRIVLFDTLLASLNNDEVCAVLAHELGHYHHGHVKKRLVFMSMVSLIGFAMLGWLADSPWFYAALGMAHASDAAALVLFMLIVPVLGFWLLPMANALSRHHEFEADAYAAKKTSAFTLVSALVKMYRDNAAPLITDPWYSAWHDSHPPAPLRIRHLRSDVETG